MTPSSKSQAVALVCAALPALVPLSTVWAADKAAPKAAKAAYPTGPGSLAGMWQSPYPPDLAQALERL